jgi:hypothetical protein
MRRTRGPTAPPLFLVHFSFRSNSGNCVLLRLGFLSGPTGQETAPPMPLAPEIAQPRHGLFESYPASESVSVEALQCPGRPILCASTANQRASRASSGTLPAHWDPPMPHLPAGSSYQIISWQGCLAPAPGKTRHSISELAHQCPAPPFPFGFPFAVVISASVSCSPCRSPTGVTLRSYLTYMHEHNTSTCNN